MEDLELIRKNPKKLIGYYTQLHDIENLADDVYESFIINLFKNETDSIELVKIKEEESLKRKKCTAPRKDKAHLKKGIILSKGKN